MGKSATGPNFLIFLMREAVGKKFSDVFLIFSDFSDARDCLKSEKIRKMARPQGPASWHQLGTWTGLGLELEASVEVGEHQSGQGPASLPADADLGG